MNGCLASTGSLQGCTVGDSLTWVGAVCQWFGAGWCRFVVYGWCRVVMFWLRLVTGWLCKWLILLGNLRAVYGWRQKSPCVHLPPTILFKYLKKKLNTKTGPPPLTRTTRGGGVRLDTIDNFWTHRNVTI